jgi:hypothetical protein
MADGMMAVSDNILVRGGGLTASFEPFCCALAVKWLDGESKG